MRRLVLALAAAVGAGLLPTSTLPARAAGPPPLTEPYCYHPTQANADYEAYGPTDVSVQAGNGRMTVDENDSGTITVLKYPNPSFSNQVKYLAVSRDRATGRVQSQFPNEGVFTGIRWSTRDGDGFAWLRDWATEQRYNSDDVPVPVTVHHAPPGVGLTVTEIDLAVAGGASAFEREIWVDRDRGSPVSAVRLVAYANLNPVASRFTYAPITDWCLSQLSDQQAAYDATAHAIVSSWRGVDAASQRPASVALATAWDGADAAHQVGGDGFDPATLPGQPNDGYLEETQAPHHLSGATTAAGQTTGTLETVSAFDPGGRATARLTIAAGTDTAAALDMLGNARAQSFDAQIGAVNADWHAWLSRTTLPATSEARVVQVAKRSLISVRLAIDPDSGAIVASAATQGPYGEDWIRDGSFINALLDANGFHDAVTRHNLFYAQVQTSPLNPSPLRPSGNWPMASYGDGIDGAPIPYEIDETGLGVWTLWGHAQHLAPAAATQYLQAVWPAIARAADWMTSCQDPPTGLQCQANEDDNVTPSQSLHGAETVWLGLQSAIAAAGALHQQGAEVDAWRARLTRLGQAIDALYDPQANAYREGNNAGNAYNVEYGDGGWLLWPVAFHPYDDPRMQGEARRVAGAMEASLASRQGSYEGKALVGLTYAWQPATPSQHAELVDALHHIASTATPTGLLGEAWERLNDGSPIAVQDMPHVWAHTLFWLAAVRIEGAAPYTFSTTDFYGSHRRAPALPSAATAVVTAIPNTAGAMSAAPAAAAGLLFLVALGVCSLRRGRRGPRRWFG